MKTFELKVGNLQIDGLYEIPNKADHAIALIHGFGEHKGRYKHVSEFFLDRAYAVFKIDLSGHGKSTGRRGDILSMQQYIDEVTALIRYIDDATSGLPIILYGHSMGGLIAATYALEQQEKLHKLVLSSPWFQLAIVPPKFKLAAARILHKLKLNFSQNANLNADHLSSDLEVGKRYLQDPLVHGKLTPRAFFTIFEQGQKCIATASHLNIPTLVTHGTDDQIISIEGSQEFAKNAAAKFVAFEDARHEPHNEFKWEDHLNVILNFIQK